MYKRCASKVVIDEGGLCAYAPQTEPDPDENVRVHKIHCDNLVLLHPLALQPGAIFEDDFVCLSICPRIAFKNNPRIMRSRLSLALQGIEVIQVIATFSQTELELDRDDGEEQGPVKHAGTHLP